MPRPKNHTFSRNAWHVGLAAEGGKVQQLLFSCKCVVVCVVVWLWYPMLQQKPLGPQKHFGIPLTLFANLALGVSSLASRGGPQDGQAGLSTDYLGLIVLI